MNKKIIRRPIGRFSIFVVGIAALVLVGFTGLAATNEARATVVTLHFNNLPSAQGWTFITDSVSPELDLFSTNGTVLNQNTMGVGVAGALYRFPQDFGSSLFTLSVRAQIISDLVVQPDDCAPTCHASMGFEAATNGYIFGFFIGAGEVIGVDALQRLLSNSIDTSLYHNYLLAGSPLTGAYQVFVDGISIGGGTALGTALDASGQFLFLGDGASRANANGNIAFFQFSNELATPLPAALPLFATGLGALGLLGWRRKRKNAAALAAA